MTARVKRISLGPDPREEIRARRPSGAPPRLAAWFLPPILLGSVFAGISLVFRGPDEWFGWTLAVLLGLGIGWVAVSALLPARADRRCPACGKEALRRLDPRTTRGVTCSACGYTDELASSFYLAEAEGPLEEIVLRERASRHAPNRRETPS